MSEYRDQLMKLFDDRCGMCIINPAVCIHEIQPRSLYPGWEDDLSNGIPLCEACHKMVTDNPDVYRDHLPYIREQTLVILGVLLSPVYSK